MVVRRSPALSVLIYERDTPSDRMVYPVVTAERYKRTSLATWERRVVSGAPDADAEEIISSWTQKDYSGGIGIEDANEGTDISRTRMAIMDLRSPGQVVLPPYTWAPAPPSGASGSALPLGDVVTDEVTDDPRMYVAWGSHAWGWDEDTLAWTSTDNNLGKTPLDSGVRFGGYLFVPCGSAGALALRHQNSAAGNLGTGLKAIANTQIAPHAFGTWDSRLWAISTTNRLYELTPAQCESDPTTGWSKVASELEGDLILDRSHTPRHLFTFYNRDGKEVLWCVTDKGAFMFDFDGPRWIQTTIKPAPHPQFGLGAVPWRDEDLFIAAGGMGIARRTSADVNVPLAGPGPNLPAEYTGQIVDLEGEPSGLYALVKGLPVNTAPTLGEIAAPGNETAYLATSTMPMWLACWTGTAWCGLWENPDTTAEPTKLHLSTASDSYRLWWGDSDGQAYSQTIPLTPYNPRAKVRLGQEAFAESGWWETIRYDAQMIGWDKIASHAFATMDYASDTAYVDVAYRTDTDYPDPDNPVDEPEYTLWKRVDRAGRTLLWFDDEELNPRTGLPWREGLAFQWIQFRFTADRRQAPTSAVSPVWQSFSLHHIRVPQDAASFVIKIPFFEGPGSRGFGHRSGREMAATLRSMQRLRKMVTFQPTNEESFRGRIVGIAEEGYAGGANFSSVMVINFVEIGASANANLNVA